MSARLLVELIPTGEVISVTVVEGSGNSAFDQSAEQAVRKARRFVVPDENAQFERYFRRFYFCFSGRLIALAGVLVVSTGRWC